MTERLGGGEHFARMNARVYIGPIPGDFAVAVDQERDPVVAEEGFAYSV